MKKIICLILIVLMLPVTSLMLSGCEKEKSYKLHTFYKEYKNIGDSAINLKLDDIKDVFGLNINSYRITIDFTKSSELSQLVERKNTPYYQLKYFYQKLLDDSLSPVALFGSKVAINDKVSKKQTKKLFENLETVKQEFNDIDYYLGILAQSLKASNSEFINSSHLKNLLEQYEQAITASNNLSSVVCDVYFETVLNNPNYNYSEKTANQLTDADLTRIAIDTRERLYYYKSAYAHAFNQLYIKDKKLPEQFINGNFTISTYAPYEQISTITRLENKDASALIQNKEVVSKIYTNAVSLYNLQKDFSTAYKHFTNAGNKVSINKLSNKSSVSDINYGEFMYQFAYGIASDSWKIANNLITLLYN